MDGVSTMLNTADLSNPLIKAESDKIDEFLIENKVRVGSIFLSILPLFLRKFKPHITVTPVIVLGQTTTLIRMENRIKIDGDYHRVWFNELLLDRIDSGDGVGFFWESIGEYLSDGS